MNPDQKDTCYRGDTAETLAWRVAELEQENARLKQENDRFNRILKSTPVFVFVITREYQIIYLNHSRADCHEQPTGMYIRDFVTLEDAKVLEAAITRTFEEQREQMVRIRSETTGRMLQTLYAPMKACEGEPLVVGVSLDVTEEHEKLDAIIQSKDKIAEELAESDRRLEIMVDNTPVPVSISDLETGQILYGNKALAETFAIPYDKIQDQVASNYYADPAQRQSLLGRISRGEPIRGNTLRMKTHNGDILHLALYIDKIKYAQRSAMLTCFLDISAHKQREEGILRDRMALRRLLDTNERDRRLIAYEIHDGVVQDMTGSLMFLQTGVSLIPTDTDGQVEVKRGTQLLANAIGEIRRLLNGLRPLSLEEGGVVAAIDDLVTRMMEDNFAIDFHHDLEFSRLAPSLEMAIYRTVQEAVNNARRHSQANTASITILQIDKEIKISVRDEGCGFDPSQVDPRRCGLSGIYERANLLGGEARILSSPGHGTLVKVILPLGDYLDSDEAGR
ncbi:PAS domain-containing sensor histidine kinase [Bremerella cremea]|uniref:PAS domain-containing sensor histidine kinase n=1 Tax=Bremerella cremea TaxID=1031537 RepID=UPI0013143931|nr:PAS domain S-box protein [Bremerella cremea]